jgi:hypothetical protein
MNPSRVSDCILGAHPMPSPRRSEQFALGKLTPLLHGVGVAFGLPPALARLRLLLGQLLLGVLQRERLGAYWSARHPDAVSGHVGPSPKIFEGVSMAEKKSPRKTAARAGKEDGEGAVLAVIAEMPGPDRVLGERLHAIIKACAPGLSPRLWYGMPAYARGGKVICFFQSAQKFETRYATLGFMHDANLDEGATWPTAFALKGLTAAEEERIAALVKKALS